jgi:molybdenum cofactor cytidylyltransferase
LGEEKISQVYSHAQRRGISLLLEADGSRLRPAKAPAEHEPNIPPFVDGVVVVFGLSALGMPLNEKWVHRVERFSDLSGLSEGDQISAEAAIRVLLHSQGGLKGIPSGVRRYCLLNQADKPQLTSLGNRIARSLIPAYDTCLVASLQGKSSPKSEAIGIVDDEFSADSTLHAVHEAVYGIILAAGGSDRMGRTKQILPWRGEPLVRHVARTASDAGLSGVTAVVGAVADQVGEALVDLQVDLVDNPEWEVGQSSSVQVGLNHLPEGAGGAIFLLADQPLVPATLIRALIEKRALTMAPIVLPLIDGHRGNPVLFGWQTFDELLSIQGDKGGRAIFSKFPLEWVEWHDSAVLNDVDTPDDYQRLISMND